MPVSAPGPHIALNLIFLVPGETGGMEVYARELIPALLAQAPDGMRFTAFINRETAAAGAGPGPVSGRFRRVVTVHDLIYARFPEAHAGIRDKGMKVLVPWAARRSDRAIADSQR